MEFGLQYFPCVGPDQKSGAQYFDECLRLTDYADEYGFTHVRTVEHYFHPYGGYSPNPIVFLSALSQRTRKARVIAGAVLPVFNNPLKLAGEIGMLDAISGGRAEIGFARAFLPHEYEHFGISLDESVARFDEGMKQIDMLLTGENVSDDGEFHQFRNVTSLPRPTQKPRPNFWTAAFATPESFEKAGRVGNYIMAIPIGSSEMAELIGIYREAWKSAGHAGNGRVMLAFHMYCHEDTDEAARIARGPLTRYLKSLVDSARDWVNGAVSDNYKGYGKMIEALDRETFETQVEKGSAWVGTPEELSEQIRAYDTAIGGFDDASLQVNFNDMSYEDAEKSLKLFGEKVMPTFARRQAELT